MEDERIEEDLMSEQTWTEFKRKELEGVKKAIRKTKSKTKRKIYKSYARASSKHDFLLDMED